MSTDVKSAVSELLRHVAPKLEELRRRLNTDSYGDEAYRDALGEFIAILREEHDRPLPPLNPCQ